MLLKKIAHDKTSKGTLSKQSVHFNGNKNYDLRYNLSDFQLTILNVVLACIKKVIKYFITHHMHIFLNNLLIFIIKCKPKIVIPHSWKNFKIILCAKI